MAEPFVFCFRPGPGGHPEQMYIHDVLCGCGVCGHPQIQRFYLATPLHALHRAVLWGLVTASNSVAHYLCENCGEEVGAEDVEVAVLRFAFADDAGELVFFVRDFGVVDGPDVALQCLPNRRLDPQVQPRFEPDPSAGDVLHCERPFSPLLITSTFGRHLSIKQAMISLFQSWDGTEEDGDYVFMLSRVARGAFLVAGDAYEGLEHDILLEQEIVSYEHDLHWMSLSTMGPPQLPFFEDVVRGLPGQWRAWMPDVMQECILDGDCAMWMGVDLTIIQEVFERALGVARLEFAVEKLAGDDVRYVRITTPHKESLDLSLSLSQMAARAFWTGLSPGDAARLSAEEIVGMLLKVWSF